MISLILLRSVLISRMSSTLSFIIRILSSLWIYLSFSRLLLNILTSFSRFFFWLRYSVLMSPSTFCCLTSLSLTCLTNNLSVSEQSSSGFKMYCAREYTSSLKRDIFTYCEVVIALFSIKKNNIVFEKRNSIFSNLCPLISSFIAS